MTFHMFLCNFCFSFFFRTISNHLIFLLVLIFVDKRTNSRRQQQQPPSHNTKKINKIEITSHTYIHKQSSSNFVFSVLCRRRRRLKSLPCSRIANKRWRRMDRWMGRYGTCLFVRPFTSFVVDSLYFSFLLWDIENEFQIVENYRCII